MIKNKRIKKNWSEEDIKILVWVISKYCQYHGIVNIKDGMVYIKLYIDLSRLD